MNLTIMKKIQLLFFLISFPFALFSQTITFEGAVYEKTKEPVKNANVAIEGTSISVQTDEDGDFMFEGNIPLGKQVVSVAKIGYVTKFFVIHVEENKDIFVDKIILKLTKNEKRRRWVQRKVAQEEERRIKRERKKMGAILGKNEKKLTKVKKKKIIVKEIEPEVVVKKVENPITVLIKKYAKILEVPTSEITNIPLYQFIDNWKKTSSSSFFVKQLFEKVYNLQLEDSVKQQYESSRTDKFTDTKYLEEGDLIFFGTNSSRKISANFVGVYLGNNRFVHATGISNSNISSNTVKVSDLRDYYWKSKYICGGRRE